MKAWPFTRSFVRIALLLPLWASPALAEDWRFTDVPRVVAMSDIHGAYDAFLTTLQAADVIDDDLAWSGGDTHLVLTGDLIDRGADSRRVLDLVMRLEEEAHDAGGRVHVTLGNHEVMNLIGDLRYVTEVEYAAYATEETEEERERWFDWYRMSQPPEMDAITLSTRFNKLAPPGYFAQRRAFRYDGDYGKWLLEKPLMIIIDDTAYVHGGMPTYVAEQGLDGVNLKLMEELRNYLYARARLEKAGVVSPVVPFKSLSSVLDLSLLDDALLPDARTVLDHRTSPLNTAYGPMWYRGTSQCGVLVEGDLLAAALEKVGAERVVIGHTTTDSKYIQQRLGKRVFEINTGILKPVYEGEGYALVIKGGAVSVVGENGKADLAPIEPWRQVGYDAAQIEDDGLERILRNGTIVSSRLVPDSRQRVLEIEAEAMSVHAIFEPLPGRKGFSPELAAYRLDRLLRLDMVPVTVAREVDGKQGTIQYRPVTSVTEENRETSKDWFGAPCSIDRQWVGMFIFDTLIGNTGRTPETMLYYPHGGQLMLVDHSDAFGRKTGEPRYLEETEFAVGKSWLAALKALDDQVLQHKLGDVLDKRRLASLAKRRDGLIEEAAE